MELRDPEALARVRRLFSEAPFLDHIGLELTDVGPGWAETRLAVQPFHMQNQGFVHAGVQATVADHSSGAAAGTAAAADQVVLAAEFKVNLLRPAIGDALVCRAEVVKAGRTLIFTEAKVYALQGGQRLLVSTFAGTVVVVAAG